jgi:hypothetical protein
VKICMAAILIAGFEKSESGIDEVNMGGRLIDPKIVIASRKRNVATTNLGNLAAGTGGCNGEADVLPVRGLSFDWSEVVGFPYI